MWWYVKCWNKYNYLIFLSTIDNWNILQESKQRQASYTTEKLG